MNNAFPILEGEQEEPGTLSDTLSILPEEILRLIFNRLHEATISEPEADPYLPKSAIVLSHVSQVFRRIILDDTTIWSTISNTVGDLAFVKTLIERSKEGDLSVNIRCRSTNLWGRSSQNYIPCDKFMEEILPHASRWKSLVITVPRRRFLFKSDFTSVKNSLETAVLPKLESLRLNYIGSLSGNVFESSKGLGLPKLFLSWNMPRLRDLQLVNVIHKHFPSNITSYSVSFGAIQEGPPWDFKPFLEFISQTPSLQSLKMSTTRYGIQEEPNVSDTEFVNGQIRCLPSLTLPNVAKLELSIRQSSLTMAHILFAALHLPNITDFTIIIPPHNSFDDEPDYAHRTLSKCMDFFFLDRVRFPLVSHLTIKTNTFWYDKPDSTLPQMDFALEILFSNMRHLRHLYVQTVVPLGLEVVDDAFKSNTPFPKLETISLNRCHGTSISFIEQLYDQLFTVGGDPVLGRFFVHLCRSIEWDDIDELRESTPEIIIDFQTYWW